MSVVSSAIASGVLIFAALALALYCVSVFNQLVFLSRECDRSFANVDVLLKQRHDEIPALVEICRGYAKFEAKLLDSVTALRARYLALPADGKTGARVATANELDRAVALVSARVEAYPEIQASAHFQQLSARLSELETSIADRREHYNNSVTSYNEYTQIFPSCLIARPLGYRDRMLLETNPAEREPARV